MGETAAETMREIETTRNRLDGELRELEERISPDLVGVGRMLGLTAKRSIEILSDPELGRRLGRAGKERTREAVGVGAKGGSSPDDSPSGEGGETPSYRLPAELPVLPLRDTVLFPNSFMPLAVARDSQTRPSAAGRPVRAPGC